VSKRKLDAKTFASQKRTRRQWLTFFRMCRYGVNNFSRNAWLSIAATAVMTITLLMIFVTFSAHNVLTDTVNQIRDKVDMSIYLQNDTSDADAMAIKAELLKLPSVKHVNYVSPTQARNDFAEQNKGSNAALDALNEATNKFPGTLNINVTDINNTSELDHFVKTDALVKKHLDPNRPPSFAGSRRSAIKNIGRIVSFAQQVGVGASILFVAISSLIVFNTIRMAIFNRKEEIQMMKLIGADRNFIRGPFIVESIMYGFIAALIATGLGVLILYLSKDGLLSYGIQVKSAMAMVTSYLGFVILAMILLGAVIGVISSLLATRRYLKI